MQIQNKHSHVYIQITVSSMHRCLTYKFIGWYYYLMSNEHNLELEPSPICIPNMRVYIWSCSCETKSFFSYLHQRSQDQNLTHPKHGGVKNEMQILSGFTATWMQMPYTVLCEVKALWHRPTLSDPRTNTGFTSCTLSPMIYAAFSAQVCCVPPGIVSVSVDTF